jgi:hypothetical protein
MSGAREASYALSVAAMYVYEAQLNYRSATTRGATAAELLEARDAVAAAARYLERCNDAVRRCPGFRGVLEPIGPKTAPRPRAALTLVPRTVR